jgi:hypothetical protein
MKIKTFLLIGFVVLVSCNKENESHKNASCIKTEESFNNDNGSILNLTRQKWYLEENEGGGVNVGVIISGKIQGDSATIQNYGDGVINNVKIELNNKKEFNQNFGIFFTTSPLSGEYISAHTLIMLFNGQDTLKAEIKSCSLQNLQYQ